MTQPRQLVRWLPLLVETRFSTNVTIADTASTAVRAEDVLLTYGQRPLPSPPGHLRFGPHWAQFLFYHPFVLVHRTTVTITPTADGPVLTYRLEHPLALLPASIGFLTMLSRPNPIGPAIILIPMLMLSFHSGFLFFVHRDLVRRIARPGRPVPAIDSLKRPKTL